MMLRLSFPLFIPLMIWEAIFMKQDRNPLHDGKRKLTGRKQVAISDAFDFKTVKDASRALGITINELMCAALSVSMAKLFEEKGDTKTKRIQIGVPVNIRWEMYKTYEDVKLENKFSPM